MQLSHVSTNLRQGLRRNLSMHFAVVLTLFVSLSLAGVGLLLGQQADKTGEVLGDQLTITVTLCLPDEQSYPQCTSEVTAEQKQVIEKTLADNPEVEGTPTYVSKQEYYDNLQQLIRGDSDSTSSIFGGSDPVITVDTVPQSYRVRLVDPDQYAGVVSAVQGLDGVRDITTAKDLVGPIFTVIKALKYAAWGAAAVLLLAAILLVANTIRLAALARRKEIEIMRLVGASRFQIALPFVLEALVTAVIGVALSGAALACFTEFAVIRGLSVHVHALPFVGWPAFFSALWKVAVAGPLLTVVPTLLLTRKYLRI